MATPVQTLLVPQVVPPPAPISINASVESGVKFGAGAGAMVVAFLPAPTILVLLGSIHGTWIAIVAAGSRTVALAFVTPVKGPFRQVRGFTAPCELGRLRMPRASITAPDAG